MAPDTGAGVVLWFTFDQGFNGVAPVPHVDPNDINQMVQVMTGSRNRLLTATHVHMVLGDTANPAYQSNSVRAISSQVGTLVFTGNLKADMEKPGAVAAGVTFADGFAATIAHELTHLVLDEAGKGKFDGQEHLADGDGDGNLKDADDAKFIMYNYGDPANQLYDNIKSIKFSRITRSLINLKSKESVERTP